MVALKEIRAVSGHIARTFRPNRIVLFGSYARGKPRRDSDVDLLVVMPYRGAAARKSAQIRLSVRPGFALDVVVRSPREISRRVAMRDPFMTDIIANGKVLYEASDARVGNKSGR